MKVITTLLSVMIRISTNSNFVLKVEHTTFYNLMIYFCSFWALTSQPVGSVISHKQIIALLNQSVISLRLVSDSIFHLIKLKQFYGIKINKNEINLSPNKPLGNTSISFTRHANCKSFFLLYSLLHRPVILLIWLCWYVL